MFSAHTQISKLLLPVAAVSLLALNSEATARPFNCRQPERQQIPALKPGKFNLTGCPPDRSQKRKFDDDEVVAALASYRRFNMLTKFPGLSAAERAKFKSDFLPELGSPAIVAGVPFSDRLQILIAKLLKIHSVADQSEIVIVRSRVPTVLTWKLTFITITTAALDVLGDDEIIALAAHEIGHLYYAAELTQARSAGDARKARIIELQADIVALETLTRLDLPQSSLLSGVHHLIDARTALGIKSFSPASPKIEDRVRLAAAYLKINH